MKRMLLIIPLLFFSCSDTVSVQQNKIEPTYFKDDRTGLCFAKHDWRSLANVPCQPEVLKLIEK